MEVNVEYGSKKYLVELKHHLVNDLDHFFYHSFSFKPVAIDEYWYIISTVTDIPLRKHHDPT